MFSYLFVSESISNAFTFLQQVSLKYSLVIKLLFLDQSGANCTYFEKPHSMLPYHCNSIIFSRIVSSLFQWICKDNQPYELFWTSSLRNVGAYMSEVTKYKF